MYMTKKDTTETKLMEVVIDLMDGGQIAESYTKRILAATLSVCQNIADSVAFLAKRVQKPWKLLQYRDVIELQILDLVRIVHENAPTSCFSKGDFLKILRDAKISEKTKVTLLRIYSIEKLEASGQPWQDIIKFAKRLNDASDLKRQIKCMEQYRTMARPSNWDRCYCGPTREERLQERRERWLSNM